MIAVRVAWLALAIACGLGSLAAACKSDEPADPAPEQGKFDASTPRESGDEPAVSSVACTVGGAVEFESNDSPETANEFTALSFCGVLATPEDVDYSTFETPAGTTLSVFQAVIDGKVDFELTRGAETFGPSETAKFGPGKYLVKAFTNAGQPARYSYRVQFDPP